MRRSAGLEVLLDVVPVNPKDCDTQEESRTARLNKIMSNTQQANGNVPAEEPSKIGHLNGDVVKDMPTENKKPPPPKKKRPNYNLIHSKPLPLTTYPLPDFHPTNPISLLRLAYVFVSQYLFPPSSHPAEPYIGYFSLETRSVHITNPRHIRALWEMGFFGKGTLSRSEPTWMDREKARLEARRAGGGTAEEYTNLRRQERRAFKLERARAEREKIERQRLVEEGKLDPSQLDVISPPTTDSAEVKLSGQSTETSTRNATLPSNGVLSSRNGKNSSSREDPATTRVTTTILDDAEDDDPELLEIRDQEHLQLTLEEAFFLKFGLGVLSIRFEPGSTLSNSAASNLNSNTDLLRLFSAHNHFPPRPLSQPLAPDDPFLLSYITYHHFRSHGWVPRPGIKFGADYMLYKRGPVFSHAEFGAIILPAYTAPYWRTPEGQARRRIKADAPAGGRNWWNLHCVNRVQSQVIKTLVLVYVDVPPPPPPPPQPQTEGSRGEEQGVVALLRSYRVREFVIRRWLANRVRE